MEFFNATFANFLGSLGAGLFLAGLIYWLIIRSLEILRPAKERRAARAVILRMIGDELDSCLKVDASHQDPMNEQMMLERFTTCAWEAARASATFRSLPPAITAAVLGAYEPIYVFNRLVDRIEAAESGAWTSATQEGRSGADILRRNLVSEVGPASSQADR